ncbi:DoxX family protein [Dyadobacter sediminis]|uniref:DoxX family protein n=2 Tax=Dyadobacter sediminis TaxID=1493691 RepID=A0A5R9KJA7_9BACT|nr:hypothetical protein [Dyadobacter sediminis]TLU96264.1 hypothetical protein FEM55_03745 [Dyadobacter sediminis]GGB80682.1 hypothetical protein GCM10011325_05280 [Dyadobacter sediminis]
MPVFIVLLISFFASLGITKMYSGSWEYLLCGNIAMCVMLCFTAIGHFKFSKGMQLMIPKIFPYRKALVLITGMMEIVAGIALLFPSLRYVTGIFLIVFFLLILPANIHAAIRKVDYQKNSFNGKGLGYLWFRVPFQIFLILWVWYFSVWPF